MYAPSSAPPAPYASPAGRASQSQNPGEQDVRQQ